MNTFAYRLMFGYVWQNANKSMPKIQTSLQRLWNKMSERERSMVGIGIHSN